MAALISVLVPVFNAAPYLSTALDSAIAQTHDNIEIVCLDDGSSDGSAAVLDAYLERDPRIRVLKHDQNQGLVTTRNRLLSECRGEYIAWVDADDWISPDKLAVQLAFLQENPSVGAVGTGIYFVSLEGKRYREETYSSDSGRQAVDPAMCCATVLVRSEAVRDAGGFREIFKRGGEDGDWLLRIADNWKITNLPDILYSYRKNPSSVSHGNRSEIRRLGVIARMAARMRRASGVCPIDTNKFGTYPEFLSDEWFVKNEELTGPEKVIATTFPLDAQAKPLISVIIPYYNAERFIQASFRSIEQSSYRNFEICLYDDASDQKFEDIATSSMLVASDFALKTARGERNRGAAYARNRCLQMAKGKFICFLDSDDLMNANRFGAQLAYLLDNPNALGVGTAINFMDKKGKLLRSERYPRIAVEEAGFHGCCATFMVDFTRIEHLRFDERLRTSSEDVDYLLRVGAAGELHNIPDVLYTYRLNDQSLTADSRWQSDHANFMLDYVKKRQAYTKLEDALPLIRFIDGTQTGDLVVTAYWRSNKGIRSKLKLFLLALLLMPRSFGRMIRVKANVSLAAYKNLAHRILNGGKRRAKNLAKAVNALALFRAIQFARYKSQSESREILVRVHDNWGDVDEALDYSLIDRSRRWGKVRFTTRDSIWRKADYHLILNHPSRKDLNLFHDPHRVLFAVGEPPTEVHRPINSGQGAGTVVFTSDERVAVEHADERNYSVVPCMTRTWSVKKSIDELMSIGEIEKTRKLSWVTSNLALLPGHRARLDFLDRLRGKVEFDLFGRGFRELHDKWEGVAPYEYSIAYENTIADYYFTEKLMDCLVAGAVPLYYGSKSIYRFFPEKSIIAIDPNDPNIENKILDIINFDDRNARLSALEEAKRLVLFKYNMFIRIGSYISKDTAAPAAKAHLRIAPVHVDWSKAS